ncbi:MAG: DUF3892 domain-containing protein [Chloroflexota bacterium]
MYQIQYATFGIEKKRIDNYGRITELLIYRKEDNNNMTHLGWYSRQAIINHINSGQTYMTISIGNGIWNMGAEIHVVHGNTGDYLRTDRNQIAADNLDSLAEG